MAVVINSRFRPFSMDEMLKVVMPAAQMQKETEDALGQIDAMSSVWEKLKDSDIDRDVYNQYRNFQDSLTQSIDDVYRNGVNVNTRRALSNMRARYAKEITPIEEAYKKREEEVKEQYAGRAAGMVYEGDASNTSLSRYMKNPSAKYRFANSQEGYKRVLNTAAALAKELRSYNKTGRLDGYTKTWLQEFGYDSSSINQAIRDIEGALRGDGNLKGNNILTSILNQEMHTSGIMDWGNRDAQIDYFNRVSPALYQAIGQDKVSSFADQGAILAAKEAMAKRVASSKGKGDGDGNEPNMPYTRRTGLNVKSSDKTRMAKEDLEFLRQVRANPQMLRERIRMSGNQTPIPGASPTATGIGNYSEMDVYSNYNRLRSIERRYGINVTGLGVNKGYGDKFTVSKMPLDKLEQEVNRTIRRGAITDDIWESNTTDDTWVTDGWVATANNIMSHSGKVDMWHYEDGKRGGRLSKKDLDKMAERKDSHYYTYIDDNNDTRVIMTYRDKEGKTQYAEVGDMIISDLITQHKDNIKAALNAGDTRRVPFYMDNVHGVIYGQGNTRAYTQGKTDSKLDPVGPMDEDYINMILGD